jgi:hypothetical protein
MTDEELIEELSEMGGHYCRAHLPMGERLRQAADRLKALIAENERLREALRVYAGPLEWTQEGGWGMFPVWADGYPGGVYIDDNTLDFGDAARAALEKQP